MGKAVKKERSTTTLGDHLRELQLRFLACGGVLTVAGVVVFQFYTQILAFLTAPLGEHLYYTSPAGGFTFVMKICMAGALIITVPFIFFNAIMFIRPAFKDILSLKKVAFVTTTSTVLALSGAAFAYYCILPGSLIFFKGFRVSGLSALISADSYLSFLTSMIITFILIFQIPLIIGFIDTIKPLSPRKLLKLEKYVVIGSLVIALLAPFTYDFVTSILIAVPIIVLYNLSIGLVMLQHATKRKSKHPKLVEAEESIVVTESIIEEIENDTNLPNSLSGALVVEETVGSYGIRPVNQPAFMDVRTPRPPALTQTAWIKERTAKQPNLSQNVRLISDIRPIHKPSTDFGLSH